MHWLTSLPIKHAIFAIVILLVGWFLAKRVSKLIEKYCKKRYSKHFSNLLKRLSFYLITAGFFITALQQLGFDLSVLLGAAGIFTLAVSFASQTAASNLVSGLFMLFERPFSLGDFIEVKGILGNVEAIDLLSTKIKTTDNRLVRIPNETMIKSEIINYNSFPIRRIDLLIGISYDNNIEKAKIACLETAKLCKGVLDDPAPNVLVNQFADSSIELKFMTWVNRADFLLIKSNLQQLLKDRFDKDGIEIPYPQLTLRKHTQDLDLVEP